MNHEIEDNNLVTEFGFRIPTSLVPFLVWPIYCLFKWNKWLYKLLGECMSPASTDTKTKKQRNTSSISMKLRMEGKKNKPEDMNK